MLKKLFLMGIVAICFNYTYAQNAKSIYVELGGPGLASFNYDMRLSGKNDGIGGRIGIGGFTVDGETVTFIPLGANYLLGKDNKNYFEFGGGVTFVSYKSNFNGDGNFRSNFGHLTLGYRLQPAKGGFLFRAAVTPVFGSGFFLPYFVGVSLGYAF